MVFLRERSDGLYGAVAYMTAKMFEEAVLLLPFTLVLAAIVWFPVQFSGTYLLFWAVYFCTAVVGICE